MPRNVTAHVTLTHESGAISTVQGVWGPPGMEFRTSFDVAGETGTLRFDSTTRGTVDVNLAATQVENSYLPPGTAEESPYLAEIREFAEQYVPVDPIAETRRLYLEREVKPAGWEPLTEEELAEFHEQLRKAAESRVIPDHRAHAERAAAERNGKSEVPSDPEERKKWHTELMRKRGFRGFTEDGFGIWEKS